MRPRKHEAVEASRPAVPIALGFLVIEAVIGTLTTVFAVQYDNWRSGSDNYLFVEHLFVVFVAKILLAIAVYLFFHGRLVVGNSIYRAPVVEEADKSFFESRDNLNLIR